MIKTRVFPEHNYKGIHFNGKTIRIALDPKKPIEELVYPEFLDISITKKCRGFCSYCYVNSKPTDNHCNNIIDKIIEFFKVMDSNQLPFQCAIGGGECTSHPDFLEFLKTLKEIFDIVPNYTTNGMWISYSDADKKRLLEVTKKYCGGVAVSTHPHLKKYWEEAIDLYLKENIFTNLHIIIGDKKSIDDFVDIYKTYYGKIKYFVLLPLTAQGRCKNSFIDWDYFKNSIEGSPTDIAFGANFYPYLTKDPNRFKVSLYTPELMSAYLDLETMKIYKSSFSSEEKIIGN